MSFYNFAGLIHDADLSALWQVLKQLMVDRSLHEANITSGPNALNMAISRIICPEKK